MRRMMGVGFAAAVLVTMGSGAARADFTVLNQTGKPVWVTVYDAWGRIKSSRCFSANFSEHYTGGEYAQGNIVYIRGELKANDGCGGKTLSDTGRGSPVSVGPSTLKDLQVAGGRLFVK